ncbi:MAG TPA: radical SAM protein, partial [Chitinophagaceae bacterium]|nr:radical SAM protein [Chitinophagaceae bacterium]
MVDRINSIEVLINKEKNTALQTIAGKVVDNKRLSFDDGVLLFKEASLPFVGTLANFVRENKHGNKTYFNRNFHIEPTNICVFSCNFCSYSRLYAHREEGWELSLEDMLKIVKEYDNQPVTEVHIVGGVHPKLTLQFFADTIKAIKTHRPNLHVKGFTPVELDYMFKKAKLSIEEGMQF